MPQSEIERIMEILYWKDRPYAISRGRTAMEINQAKDTIYSAIKKEMPKKREHDPDCYISKGLKQGYCSCDEIHEWNACIDQNTTALNKVFGVEPSVKPNRKENHE